MLIQRLFGGAQLRDDVALVLIEALRRYRHRNSDEVACRVAGDDSRGADAARVLFAVDGELLTDSSRLKTQGELLDGYYAMTYRLKYGR